MFSEFSFPRRFRSVRPPHFPARITPISSPRPETLRFSTFSPASQAGFSAIKLSTCLFVFLAIKSRLFSNILSATNNHIIQSGRDKGRVILATRLGVRCPAEAWLPCCTTDVEACLSQDVRQPEDPQPCPPHRLI